MSDFVRLQQNALGIEASLLQLRQHCFSWNSLFCTAHPFDNNYKKDTYLIIKTAECLEHYPKDEETKLQILSGMYLYVWYAYSSSYLQSFWHEELIQLFKEHLNIANPAALNQPLRQKCFQELNKFSEFVLQNIYQYDALRDLFNAFPVDFKPQLENFIENDESFLQPSWQSDIHKVAKYMDIGNWL